MFTKEERDRMRQELLASFRPQPPPPKPTPSAISEERWQEKDDVTVQQLVASTEAGAKMAQKWRDRRQQEAKEIAELNDPRARYQAELDRWWQAKRDLETALDDGYVNVGGFREPRYKTTCHRGPGDPDWGL